MSHILRDLYRTPLISFDYVLPTSAHIIAPAIVPRRFLRLLSLGTHFIPTDAKFVKDALASSLQLYSKRLAWTEHFGPNDQGELYPVYKFKKASDPPAFSSDLKVHLSQVESKLEAALARAKPTRGNYFVKEIEQFAAWSQDRIIIKPADKNLGLTVMDVGFYEQMCMDYLQQTCHLVSEPEVEVLEFLQLVANKILVRNSNKVASEVVQSLIQREKECNQLASFYALPKLHKSPIGPRPIVASHSSPLCHLSTWLSKALLPCVSRLDAYLRDSSELTEILRLTPLPRDTVILTFDVVSMYPNMQRDKAVQGVYAALQLGGYPDQKPAWADLAVDITKAIFDHCYSVFDSRVFKQKAGIAMGTNAAPDLANCYLTPYEYDLHKMKDSVYLYKRFIDDGFAAVNSVETAHFIIAHLEQSGLQFTYEISTERAHFLDLEVFKNNFFYSTGLLSFRTYRKAMNRFLYLPSFSSHHPSTVRSWVFAEILRLRNTTLMDSDFVEAATFFINMLSKRAYSINIINSAIEMLPDLLWSPLTRNFKARTEIPLLDNSGQVYAVSPPLIFRAPFARQLNIPYGPILHESFQDWANSLVQGAPVANPNPTRSLHLVIANTQAPSLAKRLVRARFTKKTPTTTSQNFGESSEGNLSYFGKNQNLKH